MLKTADLPAKKQTNKILVGSRQCECGKIVYLWFVTLNSFKFRYWYRLNSTSALDAGADSLSKVLVAVRLNGQ